MTSRETILEFARKWGPLTPPPISYDAQTKLRLRELYKLNPAAALHADIRGELLPQCRQCKEHFLALSICEDGRCKSCQPYDETFDTWEWRYHQYKPDGDTCLIYYQYRERFKNQYGFCKHWDAVDALHNLCTTPPHIKDNQVIGFIEVMRRPTRTTGRIILSKLKNVKYNIPKFHPTNDYLYMHLFHEDLTEMHQVEDWKEVIKEK